MQCEQCKKVFDSKKKLETHQSKNPNCIHKCFCCMKLFASKQSLQKHVTIQCEQKYECEKCHKVYSSKYTRNYHNCIDIIEKDYKEQDRNTENKESYTGQIENIVNKLIN